MDAQTVDLVKKAMGQKVRAYVLVNNRSEGNAPLTIQALTDLLTRPLMPPGGHQAEPSP
jgi:uncharacterized protein YecE (DUF72 family)